jgi:outer membrane lipoprotein-sorting protein
MGGAPKLQSIKGFVEDFDEHAAGGGAAVTMKVTIQFPDRMHADVQTPQGQITIVATPNAFFMYSPGMGARDMPASQNSESLQQIHRDLIYIGQHANDPAWIFAAGGTEKIGDIEARVLDVNGGDITIRWFVDPATGHVIRETYQATGRSGPVQAETDLEDWKTTDGITLPAVHKNKENEQDSSIVESTSIRFNPTIDSKIFDRPTDAAQPK